MGLRTASVVYQDDGFGKSSLASFKATAESLGMAVPTQKILSNDRSRTTQAAKDVAQANAQSVVIFATYDLAADFIRSSRSTGNGTMFMTASVAGSKALTEQLLDEARGMGVSQVVPFPWSTSVPVVASYQKAMKSSGYSDKDYNYSSLEGYIAARMTVQALKRAGKDINSETLTKSLERLGEFDLGGYVVRFGADEREGSKYVDLTIVGAGGKFLK